MAPFERATRSLSAVPRTLRTHIERYGNGAVIGGLTMVGLPSLVRSLGPGPDGGPLAAVVFFGTIAGLLGGGAVAVVLGRADNYGSTQGAWAGVVAAILVVLPEKYQTAGDVASNGPVDAVTVVTNILVVVAAIPVSALAFIVIGVLGGYIGHGIRRRTGSLAQPA